MKNRVRWLGLAFLLTVMSAHAHGPSVGPGGDNIARVLLRVLDPVRPFSAVAEGRMASPHAGEYVAWTMSLAFRDGVLRCEVDGANVEEVPARPPEELQRDRAMGVTKVAYVVGRDRPSLYLYPDLGACVELRTANCEPASRHETGSTNVDGVACRTFEATLPKDAGGTRITWWTPLAEGEPPLRIEFSTPDGDTTIRLREVKRNPPDAALFTVPPTYERHASLLDVMRAAGRKFYEKPRK